MDSVLALATFTASYIFIISEKINRALVAVAGGLLMIFFGIYDIQDAFYQFVDWSTVVLLFSMMVIVSITSKTGVFEYIAIKMAQQVKGEGVKLFVVISFLTAIGSAFLDNVTTVLLFTPIVLTLTQLLNVKAHPYLIMMIIASNIGGTATLIGDPPNIMIGQAVDSLTFNDFLLNLAPVAAVIFILITTALAFLFRNKLFITPSNRSHLMNVKAEEYVVISPMLYKSLTVLLLTIAGFILHPVFHLDLTTTAMAGALLLLLLTENEQKTEVVFRSIEWVTLFFFIGLFMLVGGLEKTGIIDEIARGILYYTEGDLPKTSLLILWVSGIASGFVDNIPFVAAMIPVIFEFEQYGITNLDPLWWSLALGACLGGNGTLIGASANVVVAGLSAGADQRIRFFDFFKIGFPVVIVSLLISTIYIYYRFLIDYL